MNKVNGNTISFNDYYIICPLCSKPFTTITRSHLMHKHNITMQEFLSNFPAYRFRTDAIKLCVAKQ